MNSESLNTALRAQIARDFEVNAEAQLRLPIRLRRAAAAINYLSIGRTGMALEDAAESIFSAYRVGPVDGSRVIEDLADFLCNDGVPISDALELARGFVEVYAQDVAPTA